MRFRLVKIILPGLLLITAGLSFVPAVAWAQTSVTPEIQRCNAFKAQFKVQGVNPFDWVGSEYCTASGLILKLISLALIFAGTVAIVFIILGGYQLLISAGNEETAEKGKKTLTNAILGLVVILMSYVIVTVITNTITGNLGSAGSSAALPTGTATTPAIPSSPPSAPQSAQIVGPSTAIFNGNGGYTFQVTIPQSIVASDCGSSSANPGFYVIARKADNMPSQPFSDLSASSNGSYWTANFSIDPQSDLGFTQANATDRQLYLDAYVCAQREAHKDVPLVPGSQTPRG